MEPSNEEALPLSFADYEIFVNATAFYPNIGANLTYPVLGLNGEAGEVAEKLKKVIRDKGGVIEYRDRYEIARELGDVLWYLTRCAAELNLSLEEVARMNIQKLNDRKARGTKQGEGDNR